MKKILKTIGIITLFGAALLIFSSFCNLLYEKKWGFADDDWDDEIIDKDIEEEF